MEANVYHLEPAEGDYDPETVPGDFQTGSQSMQPSSTLPDSTRVGESFNDTAQFPWRQDLAYGIQQQAQPSYVGPTVSNPHVFSNNYDLGLQSFQAPITSDVLDQPDIPGRGIRCSLNIYDQGYMHQREHHTMVNPTAMRDSRPNAWLPVDSTGFPAGHSNLVRRRSPCVNTYMSSGVTQTVNPGQHTSFNHLPWSSNNMRHGGGDTMNNLNVGCTGMYRTVSDTSHSRGDGSAMFCANEGDVTTPASSWFNDGDATADPYDLEHFPGLIDREDPDALADEKCLVRTDIGDAHEQCDGTQQFRYIIREDTPQPNKPSDDSMSLAEFQQSERNRYLSPYPDQADSNSDGGSPSSGESASTTDVLCCPDPDCGRCFTGRYARGNLNRHRRLYHQSGRTTGLACEVPSCLRVFRRQDSRLKHYRKRHPHLGAQAPVPRGSRQQPSNSMTSMVPGAPVQEAQESVLRNMSSWTDSALDLEYTR